MTTKELVDYLLNFKDESLINLVVMSPADRVFHMVETLGMMSPEEYDHPVMLIELGYKEEFDEELKKAAEEDEAREAQA